MPKYYRVDDDDFEALPFYSDMDEGWEGHALIIEEQFKEEFIAEQVGRFTRHLMSILHEVEEEEELKRQEEKERIYAEQAASKDTSSPDTVAKQVTPNKGLGHALKQFSLYAFVIRGLKKA